MRKLILQLLLILVLATAVFSQSENKKPFLADEFGQVALDDLMARLDGVAVQVQANPGSKMHIKIYGGDGYLLAGSYAFGSNIEAYLKSNRKLPSERFFIEQCDVNKGKIQAQIYVVPQGEQVSKCDENLEIPTRTVLFDESYFYSPKEFTFVPTEDSNIEIGPSYGEYSRAAFTRLKKILKGSPESKIYIVSYLQIRYEEDDGRKKKTVDKKSLAGKLLKTAKNELTKNGFEVSQIELLEGGYKIGDGERRLEFWFVPKGGEIPKPKPD